MHLVLILNTRTLMDCMLIEPCMRIWLGLLTTILSPHLSFLHAADATTIRRYEGHVEDLGLDFTVDDETFGQV